jgi:hypothetical protein
MQWRTGFHSFVALHLECILMRSGPLCCVLHSVSFSTMAASENIYNVQLKRYAK